MFKYLKCIKHVANYKMFAILTFIEPDKCIKTGIQRDRVISATSLAISYQLFNAIAIDRIDIKI